MSATDFITLAIAAAFTLYLAALVFVFLYAGPFAQPVTMIAEAKPDPAAEPGVFKQAA